MSKKAKVLLLTNYRKDKQRSMLRFGELLSSGLSSASIELNEIDSIRIQSIKAID